MKFRTRPEITEERIEEIRAIIAENPEWNRTKISQHICRLWGWQSPNGTLKDISCRDMLRNLDKTGKINQTNTNKLPRNFSTHNPPHDVAVSAPSFV
jgi:hypothetical protein